MDRIASGGMAEIYRALHTDESGDERIVALKLVLPHYNDEEDFIQMLRDEAEITRRLRHLHLAATLEFGAVDSEHYLAIEYIDGQDLRAIMRESRKRREYLPVEHVCYLMACALDGLHSAHIQTDERGRPLRVVHRDVSPSNIIVPYSGPVKVIDFGIAKSAFRRTRTRVGVVKGKVHYMSPEQSEGRTLDPRSDIFSAGAVLYEALTLRLPFHAPSESEVVDLLRSADPTPPSFIDGAIPAAVDEIVLRALSKQRKARFQTAQDFAAALRALLAEHYAGYRPAWLGEYVAEMFVLQRSEATRRMAEYRAEPLLDLAEDDAGTRQVELGRPRPRGIWARVLQWIRGGGAQRQGHSPPRSREDWRRQPERRALMDPRCSTDQFQAASPTPQPVDQDPLAGRAVSAPVAAPEPPPPDPNGERPSVTPIERVGPPRDPSVVAVVQGPPADEGSTTDPAFEDDSASGERRSASDGSGVAWHRYDIHPPHYDALPADFLPVLPADAVVRAEDPLPVGPQVLASGPMPTGFETLPPTSRHDLDSAADPIEERLAAAPAVILVAAPGSRALRERSAGPQVTGRPRPVLVDPSRMSPATSGPRRAAPDPSDLADLPTQPLAMVLPPDMPCDTPVADVLHNLVTQPLAAINPPEVAGSVAPDELAPREPASAAPGAALASRSPAPTSTEAALAHEVPPDPPPETPSVQDKQGEPSPPPEHQPDPADGTDAPAGRGEIDTGPPPPPPPALGAFTDAAPGGGDPRDDPTTAVPRRTRAKSTGWPGQSSYLALDRILLELDRPAPDQSADEPLANEPDREEDEATT